MALKLLKPPEAKQAAEVREQEEIRRADSIHKVTKELLDARNKAEAAFEETLTMQRAQFEIEEEEKRVRRHALTREVEDLEDRKARALIPIIEREAKLHNEEEALASREALLDEKESSLEEEGRILMGRLDEVSERELKAKTLSQSLVSREKGIKAQEESIKALSQKLSVAMRDFEVLTATRKGELTQTEAILNGRELALQERSKQADVRDKDQDNRDLLLKDRYETLLRTEQYGRNKTDTSK